jgi:hypothetical protein
MNRADFDKLFDAYLDSMLEGELLARFEAHVRSRPDLKARVEAHRELEDSIRRQFTPEIDGAGAMAAIRPAGSPSRLMPSRRAALAACIGGVLIVGASLVYLNRPVATPISEFVPAAVALFEPAELYRRLEETGFTPDWVCENDQVFLRYTKDWFDEPFLIHETPGITLSGWTKSRVLSIDTGVLMAKADGDDAVLIMDFAVNDRELPEPMDGGLHLFRRTFGGLVFYEITPADKPSLLPNVYRPEAADPPGD